MYSSSCISSPGKKLKKRTFLPKIPAMQKGSMTIEASLVIPLFLFAVICLLSLMEMLRVFMETEMKLYDTARELAVVSFTGSKKSTGDDWIRLKLIYPVSSKSTLPCFSKTLLLENHVNVHIFNGYSKDQVRGEEDREQIVYITSDSGVYHTRRSCRHLSVSITEVSAGSIGSARSLDGSRYYLCPYCGSGYSAEDLSGMRLFVSDYGDRYHTRRNCPHLKRTVYAVALSQAGGRRPCRDCG